MAERSDVTVNIIQVKEKFGRLKISFQAPEGVRPSLNDICCKPSNRQMSPATYVVHRASCAARCDGARDATVTSTRADDRRRCRVGARLWIGDTAAARVT